jgi:zinc D-Ala-D-Ala carboxypeptidase
MLLQHFNISEFDSPDVPNSGNRMQSAFLTALDKARGIAGVPFKINSGFRTEAHNKKVKGVAGSSHTSGWAADIHCVEPRERKLIIAALIAAGINRIGINKTFIHCDSDPTKDKNVIWLY